MPRNYHGQRVLFDMLSTARDPESGATFSAEGLVDQVATLIAAGHETTGVALFWSLWLVAAAPNGLSTSRVQILPRYTGRSAPLLMQTICVISLMRVLPLSAASIERSYE